MSRRQGRNFRAGLLATVQIGALTLGLTACSGHRGKAQHPAQATAPPTLLGVAFADTGQAVNPDCSRLLPDFTQSGICESANGRRRYVIGARGDAVRIGETQLAVSSISTRKILPADEELSASHPKKARFVFIEVRVSAPGNKPVQLRKFEVFGTRLNVGGAYTAANNGSVIGFGPDTGNDEIPVGASKSVVLAFDVGRRALQGLRSTPESVATDRSHPSATLEFVDSRSIRASTNRNQVGDSRQIGMLRLPPVP